MLRNDDEKTGGPAVKVRGVLLVLSGPSGAGKGTICQALLKSRPDMCYSVSATTRQPRNGEQDGVNYFFLTKERFEEMIRQDELLEYASVYGNYYGTPCQYVKDKLAQGCDVVLEIDPQGAMQIKKKFPEGVFVFIVPPSPTELSKRIHKRGTDSPEVIDRRLEAAAEELSYASKYDYLVVNDQVETATAKVSAIVTAEKNRVVRNCELIDEVCRRFILAQKEGHHG